VEAAVRSLAAFGDHAELVVPRVLALAAGNGFGYYDGESVREAAAGALGKLAPADPVVVEVLLWTLGAAEDEPRVRSAAHRALLAAERPDEETLRRAEACMQREGRILEHYSPGLGAIVAQSRQAAARP
jgi:hypothetical protein